MAGGTYDAALRLVTELTSLRVDRFVDFPPDSTPGNVGVCLSGGGSRAMTAGMGQLRGLLALKTPDGKSLLSQTRALSTVSGGSWAGVTFEFLNTKDVSDERFLGRYIPPEKLTKANLAKLDKRAIGARCTKDFSGMDLSAQALALYFSKVPADMLWQTLVGIHILQPYGLFGAKSGGIGGLFELLRRIYDVFRLPKMDHPISYFCYDEAARAAILGPNPGLKKTPCHLVASSETRTRRPYLVCNFAMFTGNIGDDFQPLVPVQATPFFTGIVSTPPAVSADNNKQIGGGGVTSFAFDSTLDGINGARVQVSQKRQFTLVDAVGTSSAFYASVLENLHIKHSLSPETLLSDGAARLRRAIRRVRVELPKPWRKRLDHLHARLRNLPLQNMDLSSWDGFVEDAREKHGQDMSDLQQLVADLKDIVPTYSYWPVHNSAPDTTTRNRFADGGDLENTGINAMLTYADIDNIIAFVNTETPLSAADHGVLDEHENEVPGTQIEIDSQFPPLFGYQPYQKGIGYKLYAGDVAPESPEYRNSQVFAADAFPELLIGLWAASGNADKPGSDATGANYTQSLTTLANDWFGVAGGRQVRVLWICLNMIGMWADALSPSVRAALPKDFPGYSTFDTQLNSTQVNLLSQLTCWNVMHGSPELFLDMYQHAG